MKERVTTRLGITEVIFVCPHGHDLDDTHTNIIALAAADKLDAFAVVNNGWKRSKTVDEIKGEANCNDFRHCCEPVVKAEFLDPIFDSISDIVNNGVSSLGTGTLGLPMFSGYVFMVHGVGNGVRAKANDPDLDLIVGFGAGKPPRYTCEEWQRNLFIDLCNLGAKWTTYEGAPGGDYSARSKNNMTQAIFANTLWPVLQLEFVYDLRNTEAKAKATGEMLADVVKSLLTYTSYTRNGIPAPKQI